MKYAYPCILEPEEDKKYEGWYNVSFPDVKGALTCGHDWKAAMEMAEDCLLVALCVCVDRNEELPKPSPLAEGQELVAVPPLSAAKLALYSAMWRQEISRAELAQRLGIDESAVRQMLMPDRYSHMKQVARALDAVGCRLVVEDMVA